MPSRTEPLMGTLVTIHVVRDGSDEAIERAFGWFREIEARCSRFAQTSELAELTTRAGEPVPVSPILFEAVRFALSVAEETDGGFDPTIGHRMERRGFNREDRTGHIVHTPISPDDDVSYRDVEIDVSRRTITLRRPLLLDLGAIAKGMAVDAAARELQPFQHFAIDAGGDLFLGGRNPDGAPWSVGIRHPRIDRELIDCLLVSDKAVCTSGDYERLSPYPASGFRPHVASGPPHVASGPPHVASGFSRKDDGFSRKNDADHHIIDPRTGISPSTVASVTVVAPTALAADALATAAFVLDPADGIELLERHGVEGLIVTPALERFETSGLRR